MSILILLVGCKKQNIDLSDFSGDQKLANVLGIMNSKCISCHKSYSYNTSEDWIKSGLVVAGMPSASVLYTSLRGADAKGSHDMPPLDSPQITPDEVSIIYDWIKNLDTKIQGNKKVKVSFNQNRILTSDELIQKCHFQLTQSLVEINETKTCEDLIKGFSFSIDSDIKDPFYLKVLRNFQFLHNGFYGQYNLNTQNENWGSFELFDPSSPAYGLTASLIDKNIKFKDIFKGEIIYTGRRSKEYQPNYLVVKRDDKLLLPKDRYKWLNGHHVHKKKKWEPYVDWANRGNLIGIERVSPKRNIIDVAYKNEFSYKQMKGSFNIHRSFGGGVLGDRTYAMLNYKDDLLDILDGEKKNMRAWSKSVLKDYLCRELPVLYNLDVQSWVDIDSKLSFQKSSRCMECHVTIDPLSKVINHITVGQNNAFAQRIDLESNDIGALQSLIPIDLTESYDKKYKKFKTSGELIYRNYKGELIKISIKDLDELGKKLFEQLDPYICVSKRYLEYFTNLDINLDQLIKNRNYHTAKERYIYQELIRLSQNLMKTQDLKQLIIDIFNHNLYKVKDSQFEAKYID